MYLDKANPDIMHNEITTIDHAFTRPWTVSRFYKRVHDGRPQEYNCAEDNRWVVIGGRTYVADAEGYLMPIQKDEPAPDPKLFQKYFGPKNDRVGRMRKFAAAADRSGGFQIRRCASKPA